MKQAVQLLPFPVMVGILSLWITLVGSPMVYPGRRSSPVLAGRNALLATRRAL